MIFTSYSSFFNHFHFLLPLLVSASTNDNNNMCSILNRVFYQTSPLSSSIIFPLLLLSRTNNITTHLSFLHILFLLWFSSMSVTATNVFNAPSHNEEARAWTHKSRATKTHNIETAFAFFRTAKW